MNSSNAPTNESPTLSTFLAKPLRVGDPDVAGNLAVFPLFGPAPTLEYLSFAQGRAVGVSVGELDGGASVNDLFVHNPGEVPVLLFEGEEVLGAQQNRTFDVPVLVDAGKKARVPVSCMERGRWDGSRHRERFVPSPQTAGPKLRRMKAHYARKLAAVGGEARADQGAVWKSIDDTSRRLGAHSPTDAMHDVFESRRGELAEAVERIHVHDGQTGAIAATQRQAPRARLRESSRRLRRSSTARWSRATRSTRSTPARARATSTHRRPRPPTASPCSPPTPLSATAATALGSARRSVSMQTGSRARVSRMRVSSSR